MESELFLQPLGGLELYFVIFTTLSGTLKIQKKSHTRILCLPKCPRTKTKAAFRLEVSLMGIQLIWELKIKLFSFVYFDRVVKEIFLLAHRLLRNFP